MTAGVARPAAVAVALSAALLVAATACRTPPGGPPSVSYVVRHGVATSGVLPIGWSQEPLVLVGEARAQPLFAPVLAGAGPVEVEARLTLARLGHSAASFRIGDSHFGFSGEDDRLFLEGPLFGGRTEHLEIDSGIRAGEEFELRFERGRGKLRFWVDRRLVCERDDPGTALGELALRPHRDRMLVRSWTARGDLTRVESTPALTEVWESGESGYHTYRIPAAVVAPSGDLLVFAEGRVNGRGDAGDIDLVMKRSADGGHTFSAQRVLWDDGPDTCGNPCAVVDTETGTIWLFATHNLGSDHERAITGGTAAGTRTVWVMSSTDDGRTFTAPREVTAATKRPAWTWYATGPGAGIRLERGAYAGRLVIPCDHRDAKGVMRSHVLLSDDHGATWRIGGTAPGPDVNECEVVELADGRLLLNMRNYDRTEPARQIAFSDDGGETWVGQSHDPALIEPICQASIRRLRWPTALVPGVLMFTNPASTGARARMTLRVSYDDAVTWPREELLYRGESAYSCLAVLPSGEALCVFEVDGYQRIVLARLPLGVGEPLPDVR